jgi:hypothetical protein
MLVLLVLYIYGIVLPKMEWVFCIAASVGYHS